MILYCVAAEQQFIKIGRTGGMEQRLRTMQTNCPHELKLIATLPLEDGDERQVRWHFRAHHYRGEWYRYSKDIVDWFLREQEKRARAEQRARRKAVNKRHYEKRRAKAAEARRIATEQIGTFLAAYL